MLELLEVLCASHCAIEECGAGLSPKGKKVFYRKVGQSVDMSLARLPRLRILDLRSQRGGMRVYDANGPPERVRVDEPDGDFSYRVQSTTCTALRTLLIANNRVGSLPDGIGNLTEW